MALHRIAAVALLVSTIIANPLVSSPGDTAIIPTWHLQSVLHTPNNLTVLSQPGVDVSSWYRVGSRGTVMAGLIENGVYDDNDLFYSDHLETAIDKSVFHDAWLYREEFTMQSSPGQHVFLHTHGITSKADIFVNGQLVASKDVQDGSYGGHKYEITGFLQTGDNCILIKAYPTNYLRDFAMGFVDWNPYPPDNGTGVWRNVELRQTGPVSISSPRIVTDFTNPKAKKVAVTIKADVANHEAKPMRGQVTGRIVSDDASQNFPLSYTFNLKPKEQKTIAITVELAHPRIWWPALWGSQPLYSVALNATVGTIVSDKTPTRHFGIRHVESHVNAHNDTAFSVNGQPFLVLGGGYSPDLFLRYDQQRVETIFQYMLDMGLNTVRLEGKQEHAELYELADRMGLMVIAGWECCDKWEGWEYNHDAPGVKWTDPDYGTAHAAMLHEAALMQTHPSMLTFLVGSDYWPDDRATDVYRDALQQMDWTNPVIASASKRGYPQSLGPSGMKMDGPYDWVPPNYWYYDQLGAAFGFGSEQGAGVGTPEMRSLTRFLSPSELEDLWTKPDAGMYHMSTQQSQFYDRKIYNEALFARYGEPTSLEDYLLKAQMMDYEATRAEFEGFAALQNAERPATGVIYWMLNSAWPNLHWQLFDYYLRPAGSYFGTKTGSRAEHIAYDYHQHSVYLINRSLRSKGQRRVTIDLMDTTGTQLSHQELKTETKPNTSRRLSTVRGIDRIHDVAFLKLILKDAAGTVLSRNVYWLAKNEDVLDWDHSTWYHTPVTEYSNYTALQQMAAASVTVSTKILDDSHGVSRARITLENGSDVPAFFMRVALIDGKTHDEISPAYWSENYVTLWPWESLDVMVEIKGELKWGDKVVEVTGANVKTTVWVMST